MIKVDIINEVARPPTSRRCKCRGGGRGRPRGDEGLLDEGRTDRAARLRRLPGEAPQARHRAQPAHGQGGTDPARAHDPLQARQGPAEPGPLSRETDEPRVGSPSGPAGPATPPFLPSRMPDYGWLRLPPVALPPPTAWKRWRTQPGSVPAHRRLGLLVGGLHEEGGFSVSAGVRLVLGLMCILARTRWATTSPPDATGRLDAPFFIPRPPLPCLQLGGHPRRLHPHPRARFPTAARSSTSASPVRSRASLVAVPVLWLGVLRSDRHAAERPRASRSGTPLLFGWLVRPHPRPVPGRPWSLARAAGARRLVRAARDRAEPDAGRTARRRPRHLSLFRQPLTASPASPGGSRPAHLLRPELDPVDGRDARPRPAPPADAATTTRRSGRPRIAVGVWGWWCSSLCFAPDPLLFSLAATPGMRRSALVWGCGHMM